MELRKLKVKEVDEFIKSIHIKEYPRYIPQLLEDQRQALNKMAQALKAKYDKHSQEYHRVMNLWKIENELYDRGFKAVAGIDEAGRGPLAGPVVAAAVILPEKIFVEGIDDSKKISRMKRELIYEIIQEEAIAIGVGIVDNITIDRINILNATKLAMVQAVKNLSLPPKYLLIDALELSELPIKQKVIIGGDGKSISIAAASIVAKVTRDRLMDGYDREYPEFSFKEHKGYGTADHYVKIKAYGLTPIHRKSFLKNLGDKCENKQSSNW